MSINFIEVAVDIVAAATFFLIPCLGNILAERSGILNLGVEGMVISGAAGAFAVAYITNNAGLGILGGMLVGGLLALIHGIVTITYNRNQVVSGIALTIFGTGLSGLLGLGFMGKEIIEVELKPIAIPFLSDIPIIGRIFFQQDALVYVSFILVPIFWFILFKTRPGIIIRTVGENPMAAYTQGVNVPLVRYLCLIAGGMICGLGGAYLSVAWIPMWTEGITKARGWIVIALTVVALWHPIGAFFGSYIFGTFEMLEYTFQPFGVPAALLKMLPSLSTIIIIVTWGILITQLKVKRIIGAPSALGTPFARRGSWTWLKRNTRRHCRLIPNLSKRI